MVRPTFHPCSNDFFFCLLGWAGGLLPKARSLQWASVTSTTSYIIPFSAHNESQNCRTTGSSARDPVVPGSSWVPDRVVTLKWRCGYPDPDERKRPLGSDPSALKLEGSALIIFLYLLWLAIASRTFASLHCCILIWVSQHSRVFLFFHVVVLAVGPLQFPPL